MPEPDKLPGRADCVVRDLLERRAAEHPEHEFILFESGDRWTFSHTLERVRRAAAALDALGVEQRELVLSWQGNGPTAVTTFLALNYLGAVYVPINTSYRGALLEHVFANAGARCMLADGRLLDRLTGIDTAALERIVVVGDERPVLPGIELVSSARLDTPGSDAPARDIDPRDLQSVIYTSGTTGPSKGVLSSYVHGYTAACGFRSIGPGDRNLMQLPMFHVGGTYAILWALIHGGSTVVVEGFSVSRFWEIVRRFEVTTVGLLGTMTQFLMQQPESAADRDHPLRSVIIAPFDEHAIAFGRRFGVPTYTEFNMTELAVPLWAGPNPTVPGSCGRPVPGVLLRLVDENGVDVPVGKAGELLVRTQSPWTISHGYLNDPEATARTWRNGWFHTGDLMRRDENDNYFFVDRIKDAIRRRGENISSFEVERALLAHPDIREAAVLAVPGGRSQAAPDSERKQAASDEDEVLAVVAAKPGASLEPASLVEFLRDQLPYFMIPRYIRILDELPKTPTRKIEKHGLRAAGITPDTWDREAAGLRIKREKLPAR